MLDNDLANNIKQSFEQNNFILLQGVFEKHLTDFLSLLSLYDYKMNKKINNVKSLQGVVDDKEFKDVDTVYDSVTSRTLQTFIQNMTGNMLPIQLVPTYAKQYVITQNNGFTKNTFKPNAEYTALVISDFDANITINNDNLKLIRGDILIVNNRYINYTIHPTEAVSISIIACNYVDFDKSENEQYFYDGDKTKGGVIKI